MTRARVITEAEVQRLRDAEAEIAGLDRSRGAWTEQDEWEARRAAAVERLRAAEQALERRR